MAKKKSIRPSNASLSQLGIQQAQVPNVELGGWGWTMPFQDHGAGLVDPVLAMQPSYVGRLTVSLSPEGS